jgi:hypothetical protein
MGDCGCKLSEMTTFTLAVVLGMIGVRLPPKPYIGGITGGGGWYLGYKISQRCTCGGSCNCEYFPIPPGSGGISGGDIYPDWSPAIRAPWNPDPLVIDLNRDGSTNLSNNVYFDIDVNGFAEATRWIDGSDGILAMDRNGDGLINDGSELFGDRTVKDDGSLADNGFDALSDLDSNADGVIDANDAAYAGDAQLEEPVPAGRCLAITAHGLPVDINIAVVAQNRQILRNEIAPHLEHGFASPVGFNFIEEHPLILFAQIEGIEFSRADVRINA